jgi:hypothetical protein
LAPAAFFAPCSACSRWLSRLPGDSGGCDEPGWLVGGEVGPGGPGGPFSPLRDVGAAWPTLPAPLAGIVSGGGSGDVARGDGAGVPVDALAVALDVGAVDVPAAEVLVDGAFEAVVPGGVELGWGGPGL